MRFKKFCEWLGTESVNLEINSKYQCVEGFLFLRWVKAFNRHLNRKEKEKFKPTFISIKTNIEAMFEKWEWNAIKDAVKEVKVNGSKKNKLKKLKGLGKIMEELDDLYGYALGFIGTQVVHNLGYKKEKFKQTIEDAMK